MNKKFRLFLYVYGGVIKSKTPGVPVVGVLYQTSFRMKLRLAAELLLRSVLLCQSEVVDCIVVG